MPETTGLEEPESPLSGMRCSISQEILVEPVLVTKSLIPNYALKKAIEAWHTGSSRASMPQGHLQRSNEDPQAGPLQHPPGPQPQRGCVSDLDEILIQQRELLLSLEPATRIDSARFILDMLMANSQPWAACSGHQMCHRRQQLGTRYAEHQPAHPA
ncbi:hypothetical protein WJX74_000421 [Apatococcus lobatus]|uniref:U-box domain-containing protein n=1 Tax=Apatococcus lobatus TaxID=904363 RepID=A0AAW1S8S3_9CHLO